jgi:sec-independent protein translocase protein TatA
MFDPSAPHIIILLAVVLLLFGSSRLPGAARSLGKSMHIFKNSVKGLDEDDPQHPPTTYTQATFVPTAQPAPPAQQPQAWSAPPQLATPQPGATPQQAQLDDLQRQIVELQRLSAAGNSAGAQVSDAPPSAAH